MSETNEIEAGDVVARANGLARELAMAALLRQHDPEMGELLLDLVDELVNDRDRSWVLVHLAKLAGDGLADKCALVAGASAGAVSPDLVPSLVFMHEALVETGAFS